jgi:DNA topoisomerase-3
MARRIKVLNVAEKPSVARAIADILGKKQAQKRPGKSAYNYIFEFPFTVNGTECDMVVTSVSGHLIEFDFPPEYAQWHRWEPEVLFDVPIQRIIPEENRPIAETLKREARKCKWLILWLDCDREGENISFEVIDVCREVNPQLFVYRARFSALTPRDIYNAINNLTAPNQLDSFAVEARRELDLRIGVVFTRFQSLRWKEKFQLGVPKNQPISYGPCQFPTLGFVVDRYWRHKVFKPEKFWTIQCRVERNDSVAEFTWNRSRLFDQHSCIVLYELCVENPMATVTHIEQKPSKKLRPFPLTTVQLQKLCAQKLKISSEETMNIAEKLYQSGYISYPRTETSKYGVGFDFRSLIALQKDDPSWGQYATKLLTTDAFRVPRVGKSDDQSHPPIHPTKYTNELTDKHKAIYELIVRHFLASCSDDALGKETTVTVDIAGETFSCKGVAVVALNYLEVWKYDKWTDKTIPLFQLNEQFIPTSLEIHEGQTTAPPLLTESELIQLMYEHGIGTDATIAEHIANIQERGYAVKGTRGEFSPTKLGEALIAGYNAIGLRKLALPQLRAETEEEMVAISQGQKTKEEMIQRNITLYKDIFLHVKAKADKLDQAIGRYYNLCSDHYESEQRDLSVCGRCKGQMHLRVTNSKQMLYCEQCQQGHYLPQGKIVPLDHMCPLCGFQVLSVTSLTKGHTWNLCPWCWSHPPDIETANETKKERNMPCFKCAAVCPLAGRRVDQTVLSCPRCGRDMRLKKKKDGNSFFIGCSGYPNCTKILSLPAAIETVEVTGTRCSQCQHHNLHKLTITFNPKKIRPGDPIQYEGCIGGCDPLLSDLLAQCNRITITKWFADENPSANIKSSTTVTLRENQTTHPERRVSNRSQRDVDNNPKIPFRSCFCGIPAIVKIAGPSSQNPGREYFTCSRPIGEKCNFFEWTDSPSQQQHSSISWDNNFVSHRHSSTKEAKNSKITSKMKKASTVVASKGYAYKKASKKKRTCSICKTPGHTKATCPQRE